MPIGSPGDIDPMSGGQTTPFGIAAVSPDGRLIATTTARGTEGQPGSSLLLVDAVSGARVRDWLEESHPQAGITFSPDSRRLLTWGSRPGTAVLRDLSALGPSQPLFRSLGVAIHHAAFSPDGSALLLGCRDGTGRFWDVTRDVPVHSPRRPRHAYPITAVAFDPWSPRIVTGCHAGTVRLWDRTSGALLHDLRGNAGEITAVAFSPDGTTLLTASLDATARFWDVASGRQLGPPLYHTDAVLSVAFQPQGRVVATGTKDASVRLWRVPDAPMKGDTDQITRVVEERTGFRCHER
jgi:WD40 repeat protein